MSHRSLILAGGGLKVGYQAGVLQVWLDEAGLTFDHADGASGGCFNLAMYCQGMTRHARSPTTGARSIRSCPSTSTSPASGRSAPSLFTHDNFRARVLPFWGIDWNDDPAVDRRPARSTSSTSRRSSSRCVPHVADDRGPARSPRVSLPMWFPPVKIDGDTYIDVGLHHRREPRGGDPPRRRRDLGDLDGQPPGRMARRLRRAVLPDHRDGRRHATSSRIWKRLEENNARIAAGQPGEFGRTIALNLIEAEVPVHYLFNFSRDRMAEAVNLGVEDARAWCRARNIPLTAGPPIAAAAAAPQVTSLQFTEEMKGFVERGATRRRTRSSRRPPPQGKDANGALTLQLTVDVADVDRLRHLARSTRPARRLHRVAARRRHARRSTSGTFNLLVDAGDPTRKQMKYRLFFTGADGQRLHARRVQRHRGTDVRQRLAGHDDAVHVASWQGHVGGQDSGHDRSRRGVIGIRPEDFFFRQLFSFRVQGPTLAARTAGADTLRRAVPRQAVGRLRPPGRAVLQARSDGSAHGDERLRRDRHRQRIRRRDHRVPAGGSRLPRARARARPALGPEELPARSRTTRGSGTTSTRSAATAGSTSACFRTCRSSRAPASAAARWSTPTSRSRRSPRPSTTGWPPEITFAELEPHYDARRHDARTSSGCRQASGPSGRS